MAAPEKADINASILGIEKIEDPKEQAEALAAEAENIDPDSPLLGEVFRLVLEADPSFGGRRRAYQALLPKLTPELIEQALDMIEKYENDKLKAEELGFLAPYLPPESYSRVLDMTAGIQSEAARGRALEGLFPHLPEAGQEQALSILQSFSEPAELIYTGLDLLQYMKQDTRAFIDSLAELSERVEDPMTRAHLYTVLAPLLDREGNQRMADELLSRAEEITKSTEDSRLDVRLKTAWGHHKRHAGDLTAAQDSFEQALKMASKPEERADIMTPLGQTLREMGNSEQALETFFESDRLNRKIGNLAARYQAVKNIAELQREMGQMQEAAETQRRLDELLIELKNAGYSPDAGIIRYADFNLTTRFVPDIPTAEDALNFTPLVEALGDMLCDTNTDLPLAIALTAPWGGGKSSLMMQLQKYLTDEERSKNGRRWQAVWFDAWKYETNEQVWASLAKRIYDHPQSSMDYWERVRFRIDLEHRRGKLGRDIALTALTIGFGILSGYVVKQWASITQAVPFLAAGGVLVALAGFFSRYGTKLWQPFKRAMDRHSEIHKKYSERMGFSAEANEDIGHLVKAITATQSKALVIFVDDLDRCGPNHVANVVEAINQIFNTARDRQCAFILGMDRDVVVASIQHEYRHVIGQLRGINPVLANHFGENFLGKIVQATIQIPPPGPTAMAGLLGKITGNDPPEEMAAEQKQFDEENVEKAIGVFKKTELNNPVDAEMQRTTVEKSLPDISSEDIDEALRQVRSDLLTSDSRDVAAAEFAVLKYLPPNPRTLKRFDNLFRLQLHVTNNTPGARIKFHYEEIEAMARWVALRFRWPDLAKLIDKEPSLLENLDRAINEKTDPAETIRPWVGDSNLSRLLATQRKGARISDLPFDTFLRIT